MADRTMGVHHTGLTVSDLDVSLRWWQEMFDVEIHQKIELDEPLPEAIQTAIGVPGAFMRYAFMKVGDAGDLVELLQYLDPQGRPNERGNNDVGAAHVCVRVADVVAQYEHMVARGAVFAHPPIVLEGELDGNAFAYTLDPDGISIEIWQEP